MSTTKKIIVHLIATNFYGGPEKQIIEHLKRLNQHAGYKGVLISYIEKGQKNEILEIAKQEGIQSYGIPMSAPVDFKALAQLKKIIHDLDVSLICAHHYKAVVMGWWVARKVGIPILNYSRGFTGENLKIKFYEWLERKIVKKTDGVIAVSLGQKLKLQNFGIKKLPFWIVHNGVDVKSKKQSKSSISFRKKFLKELKIEGECLLAASVGRLSPEKGHTFLLDAVARLSDKHSNHYFLICGEGVLQDALISQAKSLGILKNFRFIGFRKDMNDIYQIIDFLILPSLTEGLPNVVLEALAYEKPVIATEVGGVPEIIENRIDGIVVPPATPVAITSAIELIADDPDLRKELGKAGFERVKNSFTFDAQTDKLITVYDHFLR